MELVGSSWWPLPSADDLALGGGGGGGGLMLEVELTTTEGGVAWPMGLCGWGPLICVWGDMRTVSPRPWPLAAICCGLGPQPCSTLIALRTSACNSADLSLAVWATVLSCTRSSGSPQYYQESRRDATPKREDTPHMCHTKPRGIQHLSPVHFVIFTKESPTFTFLV